MSDLLSIGASGVRAYQSALTTVSDNIANTGVAGYSRRSTTLASVTSVSALGGRTVSGDGVVVTGIARAGDDLKTAAVRDAGTDLARTQAGSVWLTDIQSSLTGNSLGDRLTSFFTGAQGLAADPTSAAQRSVLLENAQALAQSFTATGAALDQNMSDLDTTAKQATDQLNTLGTSLAAVNDGLARTPAGTASSAALLDQRDQLLDQMSALSDVQVTTDAIGRAGVSIGGVAFVTGSQAGHVAYQRSGGAVALSMQNGATTQALTPVGGALAGIVEGAGRVADTRASLNALAGDFTSEVNAIQANGRDLNGQPGAPIFATGATPTDLTVSLTDPAGIAAAAVGGGTRDNSNLQVLQDMRGAHGWEAGVTTLVSGNAAALQQRSAVADAQTAIHDGAVAAQQAVSGVNLDSEAVDLLRFQQAYSASSRVIQTARDTLQTILDIR